MKIVAAAQLVEQFTKSQRGVFRLSDLVNLLIEKSRLSAIRTINRLTQAGVLIKVQRAIYVTPQFDPWLLSQVIAPKSYVSMDSVLANKGLIGTVPAHSLSVVDLRRGRTIAIPNGTIRFFSIQPALRFGFDYEKAVATANSEKAFLDLLYFYTKGHRFVIDPRTEVDVSKLDRMRLKKYLKRYNNPKFIQFVKGVCDEKP